MSRRWLPCISWDYRSGIGRATAKLFAAEGALVGATGRDVAALDALVAEVEALGGSCVAFPADVTDDAAVASVVDAVVRILAPSGF